MPLTPAADFVWPIIDLIDPMAQLSGAASAAPKTRESAATSAPSPATVPVPCASISPTLAGEIPAAAYARSSTRIWPSGRGAVSPLPRPSLDPATDRITA